MRYCVGIDLGSTTTKAIILGESGDVLGRGITNSRSNYQVACEVALGEARAEAGKLLSDARGRAEAREREILDGARKEAEARNIPVEQEIIRLVVHGTLHVLGYDHPDGDERTTSDMWCRQETYVRALT